MYNTYGVYLVDYIDQGGCRKSKAMEGYDAAEVRRRFIDINNPYSVIRVYRVK